MVLARGKVSEGRPRSATEHIPSNMVEQAVRKLLVSSQKSGVGKTTTAINLAAGTALAGARTLLVETDPLNNVSAYLNLPQHPEKKQLREADIDMPGVLYRHVIPGLDVFTPYEEGGCNDDDLDRLLQLLALDTFKDSFECLVINAPPFFGGRPGPLLAGIDEFLVVMQAEPMAYRTMPAFLEMVQRASQGESHPAKMRGIVLTLPETETTGGRWERELRGRFGSRVLKQVVPYDGEAGKASLFGQIVLQSSPEAPSSTAYQELVGELELTRDAKKAVRSVEATLTAAAALVRSNPIEPRLAAAPPTPARRSSAHRPRLRVPAPVGVHVRRDPPADDVPPEFASPLPPSRRPEPISPSRLAAVGLTEEEPDTAPHEPPPAPLHSSSRPWLIWVGLAMAVGVGLRFVELPDFALPMIVGLAVTAGVTLVLHLLSQASESTADPAPSPVPTPLKRKPPGR